MRYRKGAPLTSDTPFSRLMGDILIAFAALLFWPLSRLLYDIKIEKTWTGSNPHLPARAILLSNHCMPLDPVFHGLAIFPGAPTTPCSRKPAKRPCSARS